MQRNWHKSGLTVIAILLISGCSSFKRPDQLDDQTPDFPANWESTDLAEQISTGWLQQFNNPELNALVQTAIANNFDLKADAHRLEAAMATAKSVNANLYPNIDLGVQRERRKSFVIDEQGLTSEQYSTDYQSSLSVSWEIDVWGKLSDLSQASDLDAQQTEALYQSARLALAANVAQTWFNAVEAQKQIDLSQQQLNSINESLDVIESSYEAGLHSAVDVFSARADRATQEARLTEDKQTLESIKRSLNLLLGEYPSALATLTESSLPEQYSPTPSGLPSELLLRRPDVLAARLNWQAQDYRQQAAKKDRYPSFNLTGNLGQSSSNLKDVLDSSDIFWSLITGITQPVFNAGRLKAIEESANAQTKVALAEYSSAVLNAFFEVENALANEQFLLKRYQNTKAAAELAQTAYQISLDQYQSGLIDYVTLLTTQRQFFSADSEQIRLYNDLIQNRIALHLALGGDFFTNSIEANHGE